MSTEQTPIDVTTDDNLDDFSASFFGEEQPTSDDATSEDVEVEPEVEDDATNEEDAHSADDGAEDDEVDETDESDEPTDDDGKPKKANRYQERINEITAARREAERKAEEAERRYQELLSKINKEPEEPATPTPKKAAENTVTTGPTPTDKNEDGTDKYALGEFDPQFIRDTVQHLLDSDKNAQKEMETQLAKQREYDSSRAAIQSSWNEKLVDVQERYPDFREKGEQMLSVFEGIDDAYGQYLTDTLMDMDAGPEVFYYLSNNLEEAKEIVDAGPRKATISLAKLEAQLAGSPTKIKAVKTTKAPTPPPRLKGSSVSKGAISPDTDDLDAFSRELFKKKK